MTTDAYFNLMWVPGGMLFLVVNDEVGYVSLTFMLHSSDTMGLRVFRSPNSLMNSTSSVLGFVLCQPFVPASDRHSG